MAFRDHVDAMRVIKATFVGHDLFAQPCQSWMVRRATESAFQFVVTWLPGRALIISGDIGCAVYSGITHLVSLEETVRLVRQSDFDYLSRKSTHRREYDAGKTCRAIVERSYWIARKYRDFDWFKEIVEWARPGLYLDVSNDPELVANNRKAACRMLLDADLDEATVYAKFADVEACMSWPAQAHWHYEALRTWANLMSSATAKQKLAEARAHAQTEAPSFGGEITEVRREG